MFLFSLFLSLLLERAEQIQTEGKRGGKKKKKKKKKKGKK